MQSICVYCGSSTGKGDAYLRASTLLAAAMAERGLDLIYGGASIGLMGRVADEMLSRGRRVIGVIPEFLTQLEITHQNLTELHVVTSMHERKSKMAELADGFIALPGGFGTLEELMEVATWQQLLQHRKPIGILNTNGYYDALLEFLAHSVSQGFLKSVHFESLLKSENPDNLLEAMQTFTASGASPMPDKF